MNDRWVYLSLLDSHWSTLFSGKKTSGYNSLGGESYCWFSGRWQFFITVVLLCPSLGWLPVLHVFVGCVVVFWRCDATILPLFTVAFSSLGARYTSYAFEWPTWWSFYFFQGAYAVGLFTEFIVLFIVLMSCRLVYPLVQMFYLIRALGLELSTLDLPAGTTICFQLRRGAWVVVVALFLFTHLRATGLLFERGSLHLDLSLWIYLLRRVRLLRPKSWET